MSLTFRVRDKCRICSSSELQPFLDFESYPLSDNLLKDPSAKEEILLPYRAHWCTSCYLAQNLTDFDWSEYYSQYHYNASSSRFMVEFMSQLVTAVKPYFNDDLFTVAEIGSGDGALLKRFQEKGCQVFGFEPSEPLANIALSNSIATSRTLFNSKTVSEIPSSLLPVDLFISLFTFDHLPDPLECLQAIRSVIHPKRGLLILEIHDLVKIIDRLEACLFCHEHTIYLSQATLRTVLRKAGFKLIRTDLIPERARRGNSLLVLAAPDTALYSELPKNNADSVCVEEWGTYQNFRQLVERAHEGIQVSLDTANRQGKSVAGYGVSARSISTLSLARTIYPTVRYICDINPGVHGMYLPYSRIPIRPPEHLASEAVDQMVVFSYGYMTEIVEAMRKLESKDTEYISLLDLLRRVQ